MLTGFLVIRKSSDFKYLFLYSFIKFCIHGNLIRIISSSTYDEGFYRN